MKNEQATQEQRAAFGRALAEAMAAKHLAPADLVDIAGGKNEQASRRRISRWVTGATEPSREELRELEQRLDLQPGSLSRHLGVVPAELVENLPAEIAIERDLTLTESQRRGLLEIIRAFRNE